MAKDWCFAECSPFQKKNKIGKIREEYLPNWSQRIALQMFQSGEFRKSAIDGSRI
jgi:hypothetical protein